MSYTDRPEREWNPGDPPVLPPLPDECYPPGAESVRALEPVERPDVVSAVRCENPDRNPPVSYTDEDIELVAAVFPDVEAPCEHARNDPYACYPCIAREILDALAAAGRLRNGIPSPILAAIDNALRNGSYMTGANLAFEMLCDRLGVDRDVLVFDRDWAQKLREDAGV